MTAISKERKGLRSLEVFSKGESFKQTTAQTARIMVTSVVKEDIIVYFFINKPRVEEGCQNLKCF